MSDCGSGQIPYRVVQTIYERNTIPCSERLNGMLVTVVGSDSSYKQFMLQGGDPCVNSNWKPVLDLSAILSMVGHFTIEDDVNGEIEDIYLNTRFPKSLEGFRVTFLSLNTTFMKISGDRWVITNTVR